METYHEFNGATRQRDHWWSKISVEPVMFLYMGSYMISSVVEQAFLVNRACRVDVGLSANICDAISAEENKEYNKQVQVIVSTFYQNESIASHAVPIVLAFYLGAWSDRVGRKLILLLGLAGSVVYWIALVINSIQDTWPLQVVLYTASFPSALTGGSLAIFMSAISYLCDITTPDERTVRVTLFEAVYLLTMPVGVAVGSYLFKNVVGQSYTLMFSLSGALMVAAFLWALMRLEWRTTSTKQAPPLSCLGTVRDTFRVLTRSRPGRYALYLRIIIFAMAFYTFQRDEKSMTYLYTTLKFQWDVTTYSTFRTFQSSLFIVGLLVGAPVLGKMFGLRDTVIVMIGAVSHCIARVIYATTPYPAGFYAGAVVGTLGPIAAPVIRSITSKLVPSSERGKAMSLLSVADTSVPIVSSIIYTQVYNATINTFPASIFCVTALTQLLVLISGLTIHCFQGATPLEQAMDQVDEEIKSPTLES